MIYMVVFYRFLGLIADLALLIYAAFFYGLIVLIPVTLTLPGIAGLILTIGVAADANVVIFERIKEEVRLGKSVRAAISSGYTKGFRTIVDANVVTLITAAVLFVAGTGRVKGFAFLLALGVLVSMFTAVARDAGDARRARRLPLVQQRRADGRLGQKVRWRADIIGRRYLWFAISGAVVLIAAGSLATKRPEPRHRLQGRHARSRRRSRSPRRSDRSSRARVGQRQPHEGRRRPGPQRPGRARAGRQVPASRSRRPQGALAQGVDEGRVAARQQVRHRDRQDRQLAALRLEVRLGVVRPQILLGALYAIVFSMFLIVAYLTFRFDFKYALPTIVALFHDVSSRSACTR